MRGLYRNALYGSRGFLDTLDRKSIRDLFGGRTRSDDRAPRAQDTSFLLIAILAALATVGELLVLLHPDVYSRISVK